MQVTLTKLQQHLLDYIQQAILDNGYPPTRAEIATYLGVSSPNAVTAQLATLVRKGKIEITPRTSRGIRILSQINNDKIVNIPLIGTVAAGLPILANENVESMHAIDSSYFASAPDFLLRVKGWSMRDAGIEEGDFLAVQKIATATSGQIVIARIGEEITVKRLKRVEDGVELLPANDEFEPIVVKAASDNFQIEGRVVGLIRRLA